MSTTAEERAANRHSGVNGKPCPCWSCQLIDDIARRDAEATTLREERDEVQRDFEKWQEGMTAERDTLQAQLERARGLLQKMSVWQSSGAGEYTLLEDVAAFLGEKP